MMQITIEPFHRSRHVALNAHMQRHREESGRNDIHFMPFEPDDEQGPKGVDLSKHELPLNRLGWQRSFIATEEESNKIIAHLHLKSDLLATTMHRCWLEIGIEKAWRRLGIGTRLIKTAIQFAQQHTSVEWLDLYTFGINAPALALYESMGFTRIGIVKDRFRISGESIDDVMMTFNIKT